MDLSRPLATVTPTLDGAVLQALAHLRGAQSGADVHRAAGVGSAHGVRKVLARLVDQGVVLSAAGRSATLYALNDRHVAYDSIVALAGLPTLLAERITKALEKWDPPVVAAALVDGLTIGLIAADNAALGSRLWTYQRDLLSTLVQQWTGDEPRIVELTLPRLQELAEEDLDSDVWLWARGVRLIGTDIGALISQEPE